MGGGIAGAAILWMFYSIYKSIAAVINFIKWNRHLHTNGVLTELKKKSAEYKSVHSDKVVSTSYLFNMKIERDGNEYDVDFVDVTSGEKPSEYQSLINRSIPVYFDIYRKRAVAVKTVKKEMWMWPLMIGVCILTVVICFVIAANL